MAAFRRIHTSLFLMLLLHFIGAATETTFIYRAVRDGDKVTLSCNDVIDDQNNCKTTEWFYSDSSRRPVYLVKNGQIVGQTEDKSDRLSFTEECSLVIKKVREEDAGRYDCQIRSGQQDSTAVILSVVIMTEQKDSDQVMFNCYVRSNDHCEHTVKWLFNGSKVDKDSKDLQTSQPDYSASVTFRTSPSMNPSRLLTCEVTNRITRSKQQFPFRLSGEDPTTSATESPPTSGNIPDTDWWLYVVLAVVLAALLIIIVVVITWRRRKGNAQMNDNIVLTSNPEVTPEDTAEPEVSYVSISHTKNTSSNAQLRRKPDEGDAVTYTTVKASSADPSSLYATIG